MRAKPSTAVMTVESVEEKVTGASRASFFLAVVSAFSVSTASESSNSESFGSDRESVTSESKVGFPLERRRCASVLCGMSDSIMILFNKEPLGKGVKIVTMDNRIFVELYVILKDGVNREAVIESLRSSVQYNVEHLTGMRVKSVIIHVVGVKL